MIEKVTLCMITFNELHRLPATIAAASPYVDDIVIVDQQSTDGTWEWLVANHVPYNMTVEQDQHWGYCEPSRKRAHAWVNDGWVLVLDADERISEQFGEEMRHLDEEGYLGARLQRSLYVGGEHRFTGDYQYRFFHRLMVSYLDEIHTEPQPAVSEDRIYSTPYPALLHEKSWQEQIRDDLAYEALLVGEEGIAADRKRDLNVHLKLLREKGITPEEADAMSIEERNVRGIGAN